MFSDKICAAIKTSNSVIVAGLDPRLETFPKFILNEASSKSRSDEDQIYKALLDFHTIALQAMAGSIAATKPNLAFFEQYGIGGMRAFKDVCLVAKELSIPVIADAKRGDIGSTASAYSSAYIGESTVFGKKHRFFEADSITVNPFLGFDTLEVFLKDCLTYGRGLFVLVQTSNPGAREIQGVVDATSGKTVGLKIAEWVAENSSKLLGSSGYSGLGVVVGATYPEEAIKLRNVMPNSIFLVPGYGAQGGTAKDILPNFNLMNGKLGGAVVNVSRALLSSFSCTEITKDEMITELKTKLTNFNNDINTALSSSNASQKGGT